jgi:hypothetical protein
LTVRGPALDGPDQVTHPSAAAVIQREMARIRRDIPNGVRPDLAGVTDTIDWTRYIRRFPWASLGLAGAAGFLVVPRRRSAPATVKQSAAFGPTRTPALTSELLRGAWQLAYPIALRAAQVYATQRVEDWLSHRDTSMAGPSGSGSPAGVRDRPEQINAGGTL